MNNWYATITNKGSAHEQGLIIEEETGNAIAVSYKAENAKLIAAAPEILEALKGEVEYYEIFAEYGTATEEVREGHMKRARDLRQIIYNIEN